MKVKIGTQMDSEVYRSLKVAAARTHETIGDLVQEAVSKLLKSRRQPRQGKNGLRRFLDAPDFALSSAQFKASMEVDFYEQ